MANGRKSRARGPRKPRHCTTCGAPCQGHIGPYGSACKNGPNNRTRSKSPGRGQSAPEGGPPTGSQLPGSDIGPPRPPGLDQDGQDTGDESWEDGEDDTGLEDSPTSSQNVNVAAALSMVLQKMDIMESRLDALAGASRQPGHQQGYHQSSQGQPRRDIHDQDQGLGQTTGGPGLDYIERNFSNADQCGPFNGGGAPYHDRGLNQERIQPRQAGLGRPAAQIGSGVVPPGASSVTGGLGPLPNLGGVLPGLRDLTGMVDVVNVCPIPGVSEKVIKSALLGEFVNISDFLPNYNLNKDTLSDLQAYADVSGKLAYKPVKKRRVVTDLPSWLEGYFAWERVMLVTHGPQLYDHFAKYRERILELSRKFLFSSLQILDMRHRGRLHRSSMSLAEIPFDLLSTILDSTAVRTDAPRCSKCNDFSHVAGSECPFQSSPPPPRNMGAKQGGGKPQKQWGGVCKLWNQGKCEYKNCRRPHHCTQCKGNQPYHVCSRSGPCSGGRD